MSDQKRTVVEWVGENRVRLVGLPADQVAEIVRQAGFLVTIREPGRKYNAARRARRVILSANEEGAVEAMRAG